MDKKALRETVLLYEQMGKQIRKILDGLNSPFDFSECKNKPFGYKETKALGEISACLLDTELNAKKIQRMNADPDLGR